MKRLHLIVSFCALALANQAMARLGETLPQCVERYGPVVQTRPARLDSSDPEARVFSKAGISITVEYLDGVAWNIRYRTPNLTTAQVTELLKANMPEGGGWTASYEVAGIQYRLSTDRKSSAAYDPGQPGEIGLLELASRDFSLAWRKAYAAKLESSTQQPRIDPTTQDLKGF